MTPEQVVVEALVLSRSDFFDQIEVDEAEVEALYQREIGNLAEQRRAAHILFEGEEGDTELLERAQEVRARLEQGEEFAALAREYSDDSGTANRGGDLGFTARGSFDPEFEDALFALERGEVSEPVRTSYGYHLIKLTDLQAPDLPQLEDMRQSLVEELKTERVERRFVEASQQLADLAYESPNLTEPAEALDLQVQTFGPVERSGGEGITANPRVMRAVFEEDVLIDERNSPLIELDADTSVVVRVKEHNRPQQKTLEQASAEIVDLLQYRKATERAETAASQAIEQLRAGEAGTAEIAESLGQSWQEHEAVQRSSREVLPALLRNVFAMPRPEDDGVVYSHFRKPDGGRWVVQLRGVATPQEALTETETPAFQRFIAGQTGEQDFSAIQQKLREDADIERY